MNRFLKREARESLCRVRGLIIRGLVCAMCCILHPIASYGGDRVHVQTLLTVDQAYLPIQPQALKSGLQKANHDPINLYNLVRRADHQGLADVAYDTLNKMRREQPNNAVVIATYCFAYQVVAGDYDNPGRKNHPFTNSDYEQYSSELHRAMRLDPKMWLPYAVEGHSLIAAPFDNVKAFKLLQKAVALAPQLSYTHILLAESYAVYGTPHHSFLKAAEECEVARHLEPVSARNADTLFDIYDVRTPNRQKAADAKRYLMSVLPPDYKFSPGFRERLAKY